MAQPIDSPDHANHRTIAPVDTKWAADGLRFYPAALTMAEQVQLLAAVRDILSVAPLYTPKMPRTGRPMRVSESNCGPLGWFTDQENGYRYVDRHPVNNQPWPAIPPSIAALWQHFGHYSAPPEACLINYYNADARMSLHRDEDEEDRDAPVLSLSLGDSAIFRIGGPERGDPTGSIRLNSGDILVLDGRARHFLHGVDRILAGSSRLLAEGGRFNLTLRRVTRP